MTTTTNSLTVKIALHDRGNPPGKPMRSCISPTGRWAGLKLIGFAVWERRDGARTVTFPARQYSVNGERRSFALLRPQADIAAQDTVRELILEACTAAEDAAA
jgi:hypothetical protein